ncbi:MAG: hydantoinase B/oxoprolinase family protein [Candidatus Hodarchaeota archaeon]
MGVRKEEESQLDPVMFAILKASIDRIIGEMAQTIIRTSRNPILYSAKDFTCSVLTYAGKLLTMANSIPVHLASIGHAAPAVIECHKDDIYPGDVFLNNDPYYGNSHVADHTMYAPVFYNGELVFWVATICHLIDAGGCRPSSTDPLAKDVFEEGIHFPAFRVIREYKEIPEIIRFFKANFRYPERWYGDFLAQISSLRIAEEEIIKLCRKYGVDSMKRFQDELLSYGDRRMKMEISKLPKGTWSTEAVSEKIEPECPDGMLLKVKMSIDPEEGKIIFDFREMPDALPWGRNLSVATTKASCLQGTMACLDPTLPRNEGTFGHFEFLLREGAIAGVPKWPTSTSAATVNICEHITNLVFELWEKVEPGRGHASSGYLAACGASISGINFRTDKPYGHIHFVAVSGGGASLGYDGLHNFFGANIQGNMLLDSIELTELTVPELIWEAKVITDSGGPGKWRGGVGTYIKIQPRYNPIYAIPKAYGHTCRIFGLNGGKEGRQATHWIENQIDNEKEELTNAQPFLISPNSYWVGLACGGGGYGDPIERDPEAVRKDVQDTLVSLEAARDTYGVVLKFNSEFYEVDYKATQKLRFQLRSVRKGEL